MSISKEISSIISPAYFNKYKQPIKNFSYLAALVKGLKDEDSYLLRRLLKTGKNESCSTITLCETSRTRVLVRNHIMLEALSQITINKPFAT